ncbi:galactose ABC transporter substrate-binding protein [Clostridium beijerinckii]|uniref:galactose ABC transporter substrate-binding protein n=1 Tax=Clostridium beijerinckii TaxID=1520 RepID=UPI00047A819F|nr:galactose ABC transporter substrate-binding protein [Clostridium beijerinckii]
MKIFKKILAVTALTIIFSIVLKSSLLNTTVVAEISRQGAPIKVGLFSADLNDDYLIFLRKNFEDIQNQHPNEVIFTFYDAKFNQSTQNTELDAKLNEGIDLILLDMVNVNDIGDLISKISKYEIPVIVFNREPLTMDAIKSYKKALYVGTDSKQAGTLQGKIIIDAWNNHKDLVDKNKDNVLQYIMLIGERLNKTSIDRSAYSISTIQQAGIKTEELASPVLSWDRDTAQNTVDALFLRFGNKVESIISNDDSMAIGAVKALQKYGYNSGNKSKVIPIVGVDGAPEARDLISKGFMLGSPIQDTSIMANAIYTIGSNLAHGINPIEGTPYKLDETGAAVRIPYEEYTGPMFQ